MSVDLDRQLREYCRQMDEKQGALTFDDILERTGDLQVIPGRRSQQPSPRRRWILAIAAGFVLLIVLIGSRLLLAPDPTPDPADQPTTTTWPGPFRPDADSAGIITMEEGAIGEGTWSWEDPLDTSVAWIDVRRVVFSSGIQPHWSIELAAKPPLATDLEPGELISYGLVLDTNGDGVADYLVGIDNDTPEPGDFHVWVTDLATGLTDRQIGPPYGFPIEFSHPDEQQASDGPAPATMVFTFLGESAPADLNPETVRFYAWTSASSGGEVVAWDYAPNTGWITIASADGVPPVGADSGPALPEGESPPIEPADLFVSGLGTMAWTRLSGDNETLPGVGLIETDPDGTGYLFNDQDGTVWRSADGFTWERDLTATAPDPADRVVPGEPVGTGGRSLPEALFPDGGRIFETDFGWVATAMPHTRHVIAVSTDGESWEEVAAPPGSHEPSGAGYSAAGAAGDLIWVLVVEESGPRTLWVGKFEE